MSIREAIKKHREKETITLSNIQEFVFAIVESTLENRFSELEKQVKSELLEQIGSKIRELENKPLEAVLTRLEKMEKERTQVIISELSLLRQAIKETKDQEITVKLL